MQYDSNLKTSIGKITGDLNTANGVGIVSIPQGNTIAAKADHSLYITRFFGRVAGDWEVNEWNGSSNTALYVFNESTNLEIPGLMIIFSPNTILRIEGTDASPEIYVEYGFRKVIARNNL